MVVRSKCLDLYLAERLVSPATRTKERTSQLFSNDPFCLADKIDLGSQSLIFGNVVRVAEAVKAAHDGNPIMSSFPHSGRGQ